MSYTGFYNGRNNNFTFQNMQNFPNSPAQFPFPPPPPGPFLLTPELSDQEYVKKFENHIAPKLEKTRITKKTKVSELNKTLYELVVSLNEIKTQEENLSKNIETLSEDEWNDSIKNIQTKRNVIQSMITKLSSSYLDVSRKYVAKRTAKRLRLKRLKEEQKREKQERIKKLEERSRKIDENLQKIKDDIQRAKQEEEAKIQADILLKEVLRKKHDAKKSIAKLEALLKLRKARQNTARGRGQDVSDTEATAFQNNIERIKKLWEVKLLTYEKEESESRAQLERRNGRSEESTEKEKAVKDNLVKWQCVLFGGGNPQADFGGDLARFVHVRSQWDNYIDVGPESTPLPVGWVVPTFNHTFII